jgi:hypothetical protein
LGCIVVGLLLELLGLRTAAASLAFFVNFLVELMLLVGLSQQAFFEFRFFEIPTRVRKGRCHRQVPGARMIAAKADAKRRVMVFCIASFLLYLV